MLYLLQFTDKFKSQSKQKVSLLKPDFYYQVRKYECSNVFCRPNCVVKIQTPQIIIKVSLTTYIVIIDRSMKVRVLVTYYLVHIQ